MANDLGTPLTGRKQRKKGARPRLPLARLLFALIALIGAGIALRLVLVEDPDGGRPDIEAGITTTQTGNSVVERSSSGPVTITPDPQQYPAGAALPAASASATPTASTDILADLSEETVNGPIPRISGSGQTPFAAYKNPFDATAVHGDTVAIIVTGLGISETGSLDAIARLPDPITLAFAPYGRALADAVAVARGGGHEILLEIPLEPFDYPQNDPGPHTLLTGAPPRENLDKLFWLMARFGGYIGVVNNMGARFTASPADFKPVMEELGARGLGYLDDGSSNRSVAAQLAQAHTIPFARASTVIDTNPSRSAIVAALERLEAEAHRSGSAIGIISALPISVQTVADWAGTLEAKGITLVPASTLMK